jgi:peptidoglycan/xylan/chitin deacetylase (PgdA/CDA1 family)
VGDRVGRLRPLVLAYHCVNDVARAHDPDNLVLTPGRFRSQVETLRNRGYAFVSVTDFVDRLTQSGPPTGICALTFDDGSDDPALFELIPALEVPATLYVCPGLLGRPHPWLRPESRIRLMSKDVLREVSQIPRIEIGSHTNVHADLSKATLGEAYRELSSSRQALEDLLGRPVTSAAYPYGRYSAACPVAAQRAGYRSAVTTDGRGSWLPFELRREAIARWDRRLSFALKSRGPERLVPHVYRVALRVRRALS